MHIMIIYYSSSGTRFGLTETYCMVYENATVIEICVGLKPPYGNVACPVNFNFDLQFTIDTETGKYPDLLHDYILIFLQSLLVILVVMIRLLRQLVDVVWNSVSLYLL